MFDTFISPRRTEYVTKNVHVTEQRAPTDESVALLKEMQEKIKESVVGSFEVKTNSFNCYVAMFRDFAMGDELNVVVKYDLNGSKHKVEHKVKMWDLNMDWKDLRTIAGCEKVWHEIKDKVCENVTRNIMADAFIKTMEEFRYV